MKRLIILAIMLLATSAGAVDLGFVGVKDTISFPVVCLDTLGRRPTTGDNIDSVHVLVWYAAEAINNFTYSTRGTAFNTVQGIDTLTLAGME